MHQRYLAILIVLSLMVPFVSPSTPVSAGPATNIDPFLIRPIQIAQAGTLVVDTEADAVPPLTACTTAPDDCSLRGAILHAEMLPPGTALITLPMGRYKLSLDSSGNPNPLRIRNSLFLVGAGQETTIIDGDTRSQILIVEGAGGPIVNIENVTFENGRGGSGVPGGAIYVYEGAYLGLYDSTVRNSGSNGPGGGIANDGSLQLTRSTVSHNKAPIVGPPQTGGVQHSGGGIMNFSGAVLKIDSSTISYNEATRGGGIRNGGGSMEITNSTISNNKAFARGGGIMNFGSASISFSTITKNEANALGLLCLVGGTQENDRACGGGIFNDFDATTSGRLSMGNSILAGNTDNRSRFQNGFSPDCFSPELFSFTSFRGNLVGILTSNCNLRDTIWGDQRFDMVGTPENPLDPKLDVLGNYGGPTATHALLPGSPAIDHGTGITSATFFNCPSVDQRGVVRPQAAQCDIGAFEAAPIPPTPDFISPTITGSANPFRLWPANNALVTVIVSGSFNDENSGLDFDSATYRVVDEYGLVEPSGSVFIEADGSYSFQVLLEASRRKQDKDGRRYTIIIEVRDMAGNLGSTKVIVIVPRGKKS